MLPAIFGGSILAGYLFGADELDEVISETQDSVAKTVITAILTGGAVIIGVLVLLAVLGKAGVLERILGTLADTYDRVTARGAEALGTLLPFLA